MNDWAVRQAIRALKAKKGGAWEAEYTDDDLLDLIGALSQLEEPEPPEEGYLRHLVKEAEDRGMTVDIEQIPFLTLDSAVKWVESHIEEFDPGSDYPYTLKEFKAGGRVWRVVVTHEIAGLGYSLAPA